MEWNVQPGKNSSSNPSIQEQHPEGGNDDTLNDPAGQVWTEWG